MFKTLAANVAVAEHDLLIAVAVMAAVVIVIVALSILLRERGERR